MALVNVQVFEIVYMYELNKYGTLFTIINKFSKTTASTQSKWFHAEN